MPHRILLKPLIVGLHIIGAALESSHSVESMALIFTVTDEEGAFRGGAGLGDIFIDGMFLGV